MKIAGLIAEYNPLHYGHIYHIKATRDLLHPDVLVAVLSGNWTQRGEPACTTKWVRANAAIAHGVDLVFEIPHIYTVQSASQYAEAAVRALWLAGVQDFVFGSECGSLQTLEHIASLPFNTDHFKENMDAGYSYAHSYDDFADRYGPNDILGVSYCKALRQYPLTPHVIQRTVNYYSSDLGPVSSAYAIRQALICGQDVHEATPMADELTDMPVWENYYPYLRALLLTSPPEELATRLLVGEGIENHLIKNARAHTDFAGFLNGCVTRRYTASRIRRTLVHILCQTTKKERDALAPFSYLRVLAYNTTGQQYLKQLRQKSDLTIASKFIQIPSDYRKIEYRASAIYALGFPRQKQNKILEQEVYGQHR